MIHILYEDESILVCEKPAGVATQSANIRETDMASCVKEHLGGGYVGIIHRLDQPVSGLLVFAKTPEAAASLSKQVQGCGMCKEYTATVEGLLPKTSGPVTLADYLIRLPDGRASVVSEGTKDRHGRTAKKAILTYEVLSCDSAAKTSTLRIRLRTGRFHQIRAQLSHLGHPVLGDVKYGAKKPAARHPAAGIALCASSLSFTHPSDGRKLCFTL